MDPPRLSGYLLASYSEEGILGKVQEVCCFRLQPFLLAEPPSSSQSGVRFDGSHRSSRYGTKWVFLSFSKTYDLMTATTAGVASPVKLV